jgi:hypothetical protein
VAIAALVVWALTAGAGVYLLTSVIAAQRAGASSGARDADAAQATTTPAAPAAGVPPFGRTAAPVQRAKASAPPGEHPLLEFCHPALGITGLACWFAFVATHDRAFAWIAVAVLAVTIGAGLSWMAVHARSARRRPGGGSAAAPAHRIVLHGLAAAATCGLAIIAILAAGHG